MFGHDDHSNNKDDETTPEVQVSDALLSSPDSSEPDNTDDRVAAVEHASGAVEVTPSDPGTDDNSAAVTTPTLDDDTDDSDDATPATPPPVVSPNDPLFGIKRDALQALSPLLGHLDQTPEEKFRTTMMLIQATDNKNLLNDAYEAAKAISDDKTRAQALLDVVNEINYFTTQAAK